MTTYRQAADLGFARLVDLWNFGNAFNAGSGGCFWFAGNSLHVAIDYLRATKTKDGDGPQQRKTSPGQPKLFAVQALNVFDAMKPETPPEQWIEGPIWLDDYGWWGVAFMNAYFGEHLGYDPSFKDVLLNRARVCWTAMHAGWQNSQVPGDKGKLLDIIGGIPNTTNLNLDLAGRNCITNEVFWRLSNLLYFALHDHSYLDPATDSSRWFSQANSQALLIDGTNGLIRERFVNASWYMPGYSWLGDQGWFMACCLDNPRQSNDMTRAISLSLADAVHKLRREQVLFEKLFVKTQFRLDYSGGKGIFMRNLQLLNQLLHDEGLPHYDDWISANARAVWGNQLANVTFPYYWAKEDAEPTNWGYEDSVAQPVLQASGLSAITACLHFCPNAPID